MQVILTPAELHVVFRLLAVDVLPGIGDCYRGWFADEKDQSVLQAVVTLSHAKHIYNVNSDFHLSESLQTLFAPCKSLHDSFIIHRCGNRTNPMFAAFYTDRVSPVGIFVEKYGVNAYRINDCSIQEGSTRLVAFGLGNLEATGPIGASFELAPHHAARLFELNPSAQNETIQLVAQHWHLGNEDTQVLAYVRAGWWQVENLGSSQTFLPVDRAVVETLLHSFSTRVTV